MSFLATLYFYYNFALSVMWAPVEIHIMQHVYHSNVLLLILETVEAYGLVCAGLLLLSALILPRNYMFSIFRLAYPSTNEASNQVKPLSTSVTAFQRVKLSVSALVTTIKNYIRS